MSGQAPRFDYTPRRVTFAGRGYSRLVSILKVSLPVAALILLGVLAVRLSGTSAPQQDMNSLPPTEKTTPGQIELIEAKYEGVDDEGRPYTVTADKATRAVSAPDVVLFENPLADITLADKAWVAVRGKSGSLNHKTEIMVLQDAVSIYHDSGYEMHLKDLEINLKEKSAKTTQPVDAQGPMGTVTAQNMSVTQQGNLVTFGGPAVLTFFRIAYNGKKTRG